jgi:hypothetical protein
MVKSWTYAFCPPNSESQTRTLEVRQQTANTAILCQSAYITVLWYMYKVTFDRSVDILAAGDGVSSLPCEMEETGTGRPKWGQWFILTIETQ